MKKIFITIMILQLTNNIIGCTFVPKSFCETLDFRTEDNVLMGKISFIDEDGIELEVIEVLRGEENRETIRIWDGTDFECNGIWSMEANDMGEINDTIIAILPKILEIENNWDIIGDYRRPNYYELTTQLEIENGNAIGFISGYISAPPENNTFEIAYDLLKDNLENSIECNLSVDIEEIEKRNNIKINNPINGELIVWTENISEPLLLKIYSSDGIEMRTEKIEFNKVIIDMIDMSNGLYFLRFEKNDNRYLMKKLVKR